MTVSIPYPITLRKLFTKYLDFEGRPDREFFELLSHFCNDEEQKEKLHFMSTNEGYDEYFVYISMCIFIIGLCILSQKVYIRTIT